MFTLVQEGYKDNSVWLIILALITRTCMIRSYLRLADTYHTVQKMETVVRMRSIGKVLVSAKIPHRACILSATAPAPGRDHSR